MNRVLSMITLAMFVLFLQSCVKTTEAVVGEPYSRIYKVEDISIDIVGDRININGNLADYDEEYDSDSRRFYKAIDTNLTYSGKRPALTSATMSRSCWCAVDWRLCDVDIITLDDYDDAHKAGSSINDLCQVWYEYKHSYILRPLEDLTYGTAMLTDYYPYSWSSTTVGGFSICLFKRSEDNHPKKEYPEYKKFAYQRNNTTPFPPVEVRITDAFGREFIKSVE